MNKPYILYKLLTYLNDVLVTFISPCAIVTFYSIYVYPICDNCLYALYNNEPTPFEADCKLMCKRRTPCMLAAEALDTKVHLSHKTCVKPWQLGVNDTKIHLILDTKLICPFSLSETYDWQRISLISKVHLTHAYKKVDISALVQMNTLVLGTNAFKLQAHTLTQLASNNFQA